MYPNNKVQYILEHAGTVPCLEKQRVWISKIKVKYNLYNSEASVCYLYLSEPPTSHFRSLVVVNNALYNSIRLDHYQTACVLDDHYQILVKFGIQINGVRISKS